MENSASKTGIFSYKYNYCIRSYEAIHILNHELCLKIYENIRVIFNVDDCLVRFKWLLSKLCSFYSIYLMRLKRENSQLPFSILFCYNYQGMLYLYREHSDDWGLLRIGLVLTSILLDNQTAQIKVFYRFAATFLQSALKWSEFVAEK